MATIESLIKPKKITDASQVPPRNFQTSKGMCRYKHFIPHNHDPSKPAVVIIHGLFSSIDAPAVHVAANHCITRGREFLAVEHPAHGDSEGNMSGYLISHAAEAINQMIDGILGTRRFVAVLISFGAHVGLQALLSRVTQTCGILAIAPAVDIIYRRWDKAGTFEKLIVNYLTRKVNHTFAGDSQQYTLYAPLLQEGSAHPVMPTAEPGKYLSRFVDIPVFMIHGEEDEIALKSIPKDLEEKGFIRAEVSLTLLKGATHDLGHVSHIKAIRRTFDRLYVRALSHVKALQVERQQTQNISL